MDFLHDIFISYPSTLNRTPYVGWVTKFEAKLRAAFEDLSKSRPAPDIYLDHWQIEANSVHAEMLDRARRSRLFLAIVSPNYQERVWAPKELSSFADDLKDWGRLFVIASKPLPEDEVRLEGLKGRPIKSFYTCPSGNKPDARPFHPDSREFEDGAYALATAMASKLDQLLVTPTSDAIVPGPKVFATAPPRTILLAQVTDDLDKSVHSVASELRQHCLAYGVTVLSGSDYPMSGEAFQQAFAEDLAHADVVVQLLSDTLGKRPRDLPHGYVITQARAAAAQPGVTLMQWRPSNIDVKMIEEPELRALLEGETVTASTLSAFKEALIEWVKAAPKPPAKAAATGGVQVFINAEKADWAAAEACREAVENLCASVWLPPQGGTDTESIQKELDSLLEDCDSLIFLNGSVEHLWVSRQLRQAIKTKARNRLPMDGAICNGPPPKETAFHGVVDGVETLNCYATDGIGWEFEAIRAYVMKKNGLAS